MQEQGTPSLPSREGDLSFCVCLIESENIVHRKRIENKKLIEGEDHTPTNPGDPKTVNDNGGRLVH